MAGNDGIERENLRLYSMVLNVLAIPAIVAIAVGAFLESWETVAGGAVVLATYYLESLVHSKTSRYLRNIMSEVEFREYVEAVKEATPSISFSMECYHYEEKGPKKERKKVVTHKASETYHIAGLVDETLSPEQTLAMFHLLHDGAPEDLEAGKVKMASMMLLCNFTLSLHPASTDSEQHYESTKATFFADNTKDTFQEKRVATTCPDLRANVLVTLHGGTDDSRSRPWWMDYWFFALCTLCFLSVPYRMKLFSSSSKVDWVVMKHYSHQPIELWEDPVPMHSRSKKNDVASQAFKKVKEESGHNGGKIGRVVPVFGGSDINVEAVDLREVVPSYWKNTDFNGDFDDKVRLGQEEVDKFQTLIDATYVKKVTRDRQNGALPSRLKVFAVLRMEDANMWRRFAAKRAEYEKLPRPNLVKHLPGSGPVKTASIGSSPDGPVWISAPGLNEVFLFHGTSPTGAMGIGEDGFAMGKVGTNVGTMFGAGAYMAEASTKSDEYAQEDPTGLFAGKFAFLVCRVLLGNPFYITESNIPAIEQAMATGSYQSVLGDRESAVGTFREFVVFEEAQIYPEYIVVYTREFD